jgi:hypothetical protein
MPNALKVAALSLLLNLAPLCAPSLAGADPVTEKEWDAFDDAIRREDWTSVATAASKYLARFKGDEHPPAGYFRFMMIWAWTGQVVNRQMSFDTLETKLRALIGKPIITGHTKITTDESASTAIHISEKSPGRATVFIFNRQQTTVLCYIEATLSKPLDTEALNGKRGALTGIISGFELYASRSPDAWKIVTLNLKDASITPQPDETK